MLQTLCRRADWRGKLAGKGDYELDVTDYVGALGAGQKRRSFESGENIGTSVDGRRL